MLTAIGIVQRGWLKEVRKGVAALKVVGLCLESARFEVQVAAVCCLCLLSPNSRRPNPTEATKDVRRMGRGGGGGQQKNPKKGRENEKEFFWLEEDSGSKG